MASGKTPEKSNAWKDHVNRDLIEKLAEAVGSVERAFDRTAFVETVLADDFEQRELKDRANTIARHLRAFLPKDYRRAVRIIEKLAPTQKGFANWVLTAFVEHYGLDHLDDSVRALKELTRYGSSEFAIRPYMNQYTDRMVDILLEWTKDECEDVRRLAAEGSRPRGVWTAHIDAFKKNPRPVLNILARLKADPSLYVRKAVANNLNDISKDHPDLVIKTALEWQKDHNKHTDWIIKHACRTLVKKGYPKVFSLLGFTSSPKIDVKGLKLSPKTVAAGSELSISFDIVSRGKSVQKLVIDYRVHYVKANGKLSPKVFKLTHKDIVAGQTVHISTRHSFVERSTRKHHPGRHRLEVIVNGRTYAGAEFIVRK